ncbi:MAG: cell division protein ZapA [Xanthobacteraceae bacterium]
MNSPNSSVNVAINGRQFRMACEAGQEERLTTLAEGFDARINDIRARFGEVGDSRLTVMAALMIADELLDAKVRIVRLETEISALKAARAGADERAERAETTVATVLDEAAERLERLTLALSRPTGSSMALG